MSHEQHPIWPWIAMTILLPVFYVASIGPACWITSRTDVGASVVDRIYLPITWAMWQHEGVASAVQWYTSLGAKSYWHWEDDENAKTWSWTTVVFSNRPVRL